MAHRLHVVVTVDHESLWTTAALTVDDRITRAHAKGARADTHTLHQLFDRLGNRAHAGGAPGYRRHPAEVLQPLRKAPRVTIHVTIKLREIHSCTNQPQRGTRGTKTVN